MKALRTFWCLRRTIVAGFALLPALYGCSPAPRELSDEALRNMSYTSDSFEGLTVQLENGRYRGRLATDESMEFEVGMLPEKALGTLDNRRAAAVILWSNSGGTGTFIDLAIVTSENGVIANVATVNLGDRVKIDHVAFESDTVVVKMISHGPDDAMCCPTLETTRKFTLRDSLLREERAEGTTAPVESPDSF